MGILDKALGFFTTNADTVNTGARIAEKATDGVINGFDALIYTKEEKVKDTQIAAQMQQKGFETILKFQEQYAKENSEQSKARREIAFLLVKLYVGVVFIGIGMLVFHQTTMLKDMVSFLSAIYFGLAFISIIGTYFVPHQFSKIIGKKK